MMIIMRYFTNVNFYYYFVIFTPTPTPTPTPTLTIHDDLSELMQFLLDRLHEDTNRIKVKPYIPIDDDADSQKSETDLAIDSWVRYKARNDR